MQKVAVPIRAGVADYPDINTVLCIGIEIHVLLICQYLAHPLSPMTVCIYFDSH